MKSIYYMVMLFVSGLYGCGSIFTAGEGFSVMGELYNSSGKQLDTCTIKLVNQEGKVLDGPVNIPGKFHKKYVVASNKANYLVSILCPGFEIYQVYVTYGEDATPIMPLRLGEVLMKSLIE